MSLFFDTTRRTDAQQPQFRAFWSLLVLPAHQNDNQRAKMQAILPQHSSVATGQDNTQQKDAKCYEHRAMLQAVRAKCLADKGFTPAR